MTPQGSLYLKEGHGSAEAPPPPLRLVYDARAPRHRDGSGAGETRGAVYFD